LEKSPIERYFLTEFQLDLTKIYWGDLHNHSNFSSDAALFCGQGISLSPADALAYARDVAKLDFVALTDHADMRSDIQGVADNWLRYQAIMNLMNDEGAFIIFPGWEYTNTVGLAPTAGSTTGYGHKNVIFRDLSGLPSKMVGAFDTVFSNEIVVAPSASDLWTALADYLPVDENTAATAATIVHTPAMHGKGTAAHNHQTDFDSMHASFVRSIELYSKWGNSEGESPIPQIADGNDTLVDFEPENQVQEKTIRTLLYNEWVLDGNRDFVLGFCGSTDNHMGQPANAQTNQCGFPYRGGVTGIAAPNLRRHDLWQAMFDRHTVAATADWRTGVLLAVESNGSHMLMGDVGSHNQSARVRILSDSGVDRVEVIVDGAVVAVENRCEADLTFPLENSNHYIYARAIRYQSSGSPQVSWASPVYLQPA
jgi:hypothetical protein